MAKTPSLPQFSRLVELKSRVLFLVMALIVYRFGAHITVPGIDVDVLAETLRQQQNQGITAMINMFSGGAFSRMSVFMLGVMPYITASIFMQIGSVIFPPLEQLKKEGQAGRRKITQYTRYLTLILALFQGTIFALGLQSGSLGISANIVANPGWQFVFWATITWVTGAMFLMWLGEQISERGIGNGISMLIFASIVSSLPSAIATLFEQTRLGEIKPLTAFLIIILAFVVVMLVVFVERALRKVTINYAKRQQGRHMSLNNQMTHLPLKLNMSGVIPAIFGSAFISFVLTISSMLSGMADSYPTLGAIGRKLSVYMGQGEPIYLLVFGALIIFFCFFYTALVFNSKEISDNLKRSGAFLPGIRPGIHTAQYLDKVLTRLTLWGSIYIVGICLMPEILNKILGLSIYLGGTSVLIAVVVIMDMIAQVQSHLTSQSYESLMKKANISNSLSNS